ncbi:nitrate reductase molybdenum cofactor assembly chaperone [Lolliginicoccus suaedae]|uniref:nitrate reductase molybdenum cofactor assembly chaperone n=1 Tax=Lolliginicoccus suaedae TaxID=2605429 RepID=UPI0011EBC358|nr:nitrate reductase molybdenum cofactor assembly chaperone [Lolliginicoccus suaedae]
MSLRGMLRRPGTTSDDYSDREKRLVWRLAALLLDYPSPNTLVMLGDLCDATYQISDPAAESLRAFITHAESTPQLALAQAYVETFDMRRRSSLHLTYYAYGDTRKRGTALLMMKQAYRRGGVDIGEQELPDYLPAVLEFAATADPIGGERILARHRAVLELLRLSLHDSGSPYASVLDALCATLRPLTTVDRAEINVLAAEGPPEEEVGLDPYAIDPTLAEHPLAQRARPRGDSAGGCGTSSVPELLGQPAFPQTPGGPR